MRAVSAARMAVPPAAGPPARRQCYRRQTTADVSEQNNTGPLGGPVITLTVVIFAQYQRPI